MVVSEGQASTFSFSDIKGKEGDVEVGIRRRAGTAIMRDAEEIGRSPG
jgi:hypothetical protein